MSNSTDLAEACISFTGCLVGYGDTATVRRGRKARTLCASRQELCAVLDEVATREDCQDNCGRKVRRRRIGHIHMD